MTSSLSNAEKLAAVFHKVRSDMLSDLKDAACNEAQGEDGCPSSCVLTPSIRTSLDSVCNTLDTADACSSLSSIDGLLSKVVIIGDVTFESVCSRLSSEADQTIARQYVLLLLFLAYVYKVVCDSSSPSTANDDITDWSLEVASGKESSPGPSSSPASDDLTMQRLYAALKFSRNKSSDFVEGKDKDAAADEPSADAFSKMFQNTAMGKIAHEVAGEIDMSKLSDIKSVQDLLSPGQNGDVMNVIADIVGKVGNKLQSRISSGQVSQQTLLQEAMNVMGPTMASFMQNMPNSNARRNTSTRDRLRSKVKNR